MEFEHDKAMALFEGIRGDEFPEEIVKATQEFMATQNIYMAATREIATKLEILNDEFKYIQDRNPIHQIKTRVKSPKSILEKLIRKDAQLSVKSARENLNDIAGVRVICSYIDDIYRIADLLIGQDDIELIKRTDYILHPKSNGYRSLHLIVTVPVFLSNLTERVKVEIQIRTIAMDFWASLEHELAYKMENEKTAEINRELKACADMINATDLRMQHLYNIVGDR